MVLCKKYSNKIKNIIIDEQNELNNEITNNINEKEKQTKKNSQNIKNNINVEYYKNKIQEKKIIIEKLTRREIDIEEELIKLK